MMFATLVLERDPLRWLDVPAGVMKWIQDAGGFAAFGILMYGLSRLLPGRVRTPSSASVFQRTLAILSLVVMVLSYGAYLVLLAPALFADFRSMVLGRPSSPIALATRFNVDLLLTAGGAAALVVVLLPIFFDMFRWRFRRIWAIARVSFKEAIRRKILWVFSALILLFMFASWFTPYKPEDQVRNYVQLVFTVMTLLLLPTAALLAAFSIPNDLKSQAVHTIVTKPVERFEIVLGRFIGYMMLLTLVLAVMTGTSLLYVFREITEEAKQTSMRARVPVFGRLVFQDDRNRTFKGVSVGREWEYRNYIYGGANSTNRAAYIYTDLPPDLAARPLARIPCEFSFDIFRTLSLKSEQGKGVLCSFFFQTWQWESQQRPAYDQARAEALRASSGGDARAQIERLTQQIVGRKPTDAEIQAFVADKAPDALQWLIDDLLAEKFGFYHVPSKVIIDYMTQSVDIPSGLFKNALAGNPPPGPEGETAPRFGVLLKCDSGGQYLGFAKYDFYLLAADGNFALNFLMGAVGLWLRLAILVGLCLVLSTYLSGIISFLVGMCIYLGGFCQEFISDLATGKAVGGGPLESLVRLMNKSSLTVNLQESPGVRLALSTDKIYSWVMRRLLNMIPDTDRLDWSNYVSEGFRIGPTDLLPINALMVVAYLIPCFVLGYYLIKWREIASS